MAKIGLVKSFFKKHPWEALAVFLTLFVGLIIRLYRIDEYLTFLGDEGRDVRIVRDLLGGNLVFIGPQTSIGNMYLGPLYYYMMAPFLFVSRLSPVGPAVMIALLSTFTLWFTWYVAKMWYGKLPAYISLLLFTFSPVAIIYSKSSWNPNPLPFFALLAIYSLHQAITKKSWWIIISAFSLAAGLQMHYLALLLIPTISILWLLHLKNSWPDYKYRSLAIRHSLIATCLFLLMMSPLVLFDLKHNFANTKAFQLFFSDRQTTVNLNPARSDRFLPVLKQMTSDMVLGRDMQYPQQISLFLLGMFVFLILNKRKELSYKILALWLLVGILGLGVYKQHVYAHYYGFLYPAIYLFLGIVLGFFISHTKIFFKLLGFISLIYILYLSIINTPLRYSPNRQLQRTEQAVDIILKESMGQPFNFGLIAKQNYDESYRYFFENKKAALIRGEEKITEQLFVICEDGDACQPLNHPQWQIAVFGPATIAGQWQIDHLKIYRMIHSKI